MTDPLFLSNEGIIWDTLDDFDEKFEYVQYIINTPEADRPELTPGDVTAALAWAKENL